VNKKKILLIFAIMTLVASAIATYIFVSQKNKSQMGQTDAQVLAAQIEYTPNPEFENKDTLAILLLGYGGAGHEGGYLSDVIQIVLFDFDTQKIAFISIPRDLYIALPNGTTGKINSAFSLGDRKDIIHSGAEIAKQMATAVTGVPIDAFISVDFVGFQVAIGGILDGLKVNVSETLDDPWYPIEGKQLDTCGKSPEEVAELSNTLSGFDLEKQFECRYEHIYFPAGITHMEGGDALAYVRSRHGSAGGDFSRSKRQQDVLLALREKLFTLKALEKIPEFFKTMISLTDTDLDIDTIATLAPKLATTKEMETVSITLSTQNVLVNSKSSSGAYIVIPKAGLTNWDEIHNYIQVELAN
jgi:polyisoprenyl-teichoic acid--peptidoglycan teichoic acid transferase